MDVNFYLLGPRLICPLFDLGIVFYFRVARKRTQNPGKTAEGKRGATFAHLSTGNSTFSVPFRALNGRP